MAEDIYSCLLIATSFCFLHLSVQFPHCCIKFAILLGRYRVNALSHPYSEFISITNPVGHSLIPERSAVETSTYKIFHNFAVFGFVHLKWRPPTGTAHACVKFSNTQDIISDMDGRNEPTC